MVIWKKYYTREITKLTKNPYLNYFTSSFAKFKNYKIQRFHYIKSVMVQKFLNFFLNSIFALENILLKCYQNVFYLLWVNSDFFKQNLLTFYNIYFNFSLSNTNLQVSDSSGNSKVFYSAGSLNLSGKKKILRKLVIIKFFRLLKLLKTNFIKNSPIVLYLKNVGRYKFLIIKKLKSKFFIRIINTFELKAYNGCRKKKEKRKR